MDFCLCVFITVIYLLMIPFGALIATLTFPIKRKSILWFLGTIWPLTVTICFVIVLPLKVAIYFIIEFLSFITDMIDIIIKSRRLNKNNL